MIAQGIPADQLTLNLLITAYSERVEIVKAFDLLNVMNSVGVSPNADIFSSILNGLKKVSLFQECRTLLYEMLKNGFIPSFRQYCSLIKSMCKSGDIKGALKLKDELEELGLISCRLSHSAIVRGLVLRGKTEEGVLFLNCMLKGLLVPTVSTFTTLLHQLCKDSKLSEALNVKYLMELHGANPDVVAYNVIITGLCKIHDTSHAFKLYEEMRQRGIYPNITTFAVLVPAIYSENNSAMGESILTDLEERGLVSQKSTTQGWQGKLIDVMKTIHLIRRRPKKV